MIGRSPKSRRLFLTEIIRCKPVKNSFLFWKAILLAIAKSRGIMNIGSPNNYLDKGVVVNTRGAYFALDNKVSMGSSILSRVFEPNTFDTIINARGTLFVDVGAYAGIYSILAAKHFDKVIAVEPNPFMISVLKQNIDLNGFNNVSVVGCATTDTDSDTPLYEGISTSTFSIKKNYFLRKNKGDVITIEGMRLDTLLAKHSIIDLVKIDVEGAELDVVRGMSAILKKTQRIIIEVPRAKEKDITNALKDFSRRVLDKGDTFDLILFENKQMQNIKEKVGLPHAIEKA